MKETGFPKNRTEGKVLLQELEALKKNDLKWKNGRAFSYIYFADPEITNLLSQAYTSFFSENALNPSAFPSLNKMETEVVEMCKDLFNAD